MLNYLAGISLDQEGENTLLGFVHSRDNPLYRVVDDLGGTIELGVQLDSAIDWEDM